MKKRTLGDFVSEIIEKIEESQSDIAKSLGTTQKTISSWVTNRHPPDWSNLQSLLNLLTPKVNVADCLHLPDAKREEIREIVQEEIKLAMDAAKNDPVANSPPKRKAL